MISIVLSVLVSVSKMCNYNFFFWDLTVLRYGWGRCEIPILAEMEETISARKIKMSELVEYISYYLDENANVVLLTSNGSWSVLIFVFFVSIFLLHQLFHSSDRCLQRSDVEDYSRASVSFHYDLCFLSGGLSSSLLLLELKSARSFSVTRFFFFFLSLLLSTSRSYLYR